MPNREVDNIVQNLNRMGREHDHDYSGVARQIRDMRESDPTHFRRNMEDINRRVNMRDLGFNEDFRITSATDRNIITESEDGQRTQMRSFNRMQVNREGQNGTERQRIGANGREVVSDAMDHSRTYTTRAGDSLWNIARDTIQTPEGQRPSNADVLAQVRNIARENNITDINRLMQGTELRIPAAAERGAAQPAEARAAQPAEARQARPNGPYRPNMQADAENLQPREGRSNPAAVPGLAGDNDPAVRRRATGNTATAADGSVTTAYTGQLRDSGTYNPFTSDTRFEANRTVDRQGRLVRSEVTYSGAGAELRLQTPSGEQTVPQVQRVETTFNARSGRYDTTLSTSDGARYSAVTDRTGRVVSVEIQPQPARAS